MSGEHELIALERAGWEALCDPQVVELTPDSGVVVYRARAQRAGDAPYEAVVSSTFVRRDGAWRLAFHQQTPVA